MTVADLTSLTPLMILGGMAVIVMLAISFYRNHALAAGLTFLGLAAAIVASIFVGQAGPRAVTPLVIVDRFALFYTGLICAAGMAVVLLAYDYLKLRTNRPEEFYVLLLAATLGSAVLAWSNHFASFFLGLEILSVSLYALISYQRDNPLGIEGGIKYLVLAASSAAFLLFGMALVYAETGQMGFSQPIRWPAAGFAPGVTLTAGAVLILVGVGFKLALVPFHLWTPDVYQGAPAPVTAFIATVSKGAMFALFVRLFQQLGGATGGPLTVVLAVLAFASMLIGNLLALRQNDVKRILAYSSIAHLGYLLVAFLAAGPMAVAAVTYYLVAYFVTTLGAFGVVGRVSSLESDAGDLDAYAGLAWRRPWLAAVMSAMLLSLAGIPLTAGFIGKFYVVAAGVEVQQELLWALVAVLVVASAIGLYYYLRVLIAMYRRPAESAPAAQTAALQGVRFRAADVTLAALTVLLVVLGVYPTMILPLVQVAAESL